ncbi:MAG: hypothetical protein QXX35_05315 [Desulfurococcaceae archaeon]
MIKKWRYSSLISCPSIVILGEFKYRDTYGYVLLPLVYPRVNIGVRNGKLEVISRIPNSFLGEIVEKVCKNILCSQNYVSTDFLENVVYKTMFYGGYIVYLKTGNEAIPLTIELINTDKYKFYYRHVDGNKQTNASLEDWIVFGSSLRTGFEETMFSICRDIGSVEENKCFLKTLMGELIITTKIINTVEFHRVVPDNSPMRYVIKYEK